MPPNPTGSAPESSDGPSFPVEPGSWIAGLADRLRRLGLEDVPSAPGREASVALIFGPSEAGEPLLLMIERAQRASDPWSGQIAFPGGRREPEDVDQLATAMREVHEEVGLRLRRDEAVARLPAIQARSRGVLLDLWVHPFVFVLAGAPDPMTSVEVRSSRWIPAAAMADPAYRCAHEIPSKDGQRRYPAIRIGPYLVWGLTYRILCDLGRALQTPDEERQS